MENTTVYYYHIVFDFTSIFYILFAVFIISLLALIVLLRGDIEDAVQITIGLVVLTFIVLIVIHNVTAFFNPTHLGCFSEVDATRNVPSLDSLCDEAGRQEDENGLPLFTSYEEYNEWYLENHEPYTPEYSYTEYELFLMACDYYRDHSIGAEPFSYNVSYAGELQVTITLFDEDEAELEAYTIDRESLEGYNQYYDEIQFEPSP